MLDTFNARFESIWKAKRNMSDDHIKLEEVFKTSGIPTYTFVEPKNIQISSSVCELRVDV
jgi:hypothetical protein